MPPLLASQTNGISRPESSEIRQVTQVFCRCLSIAFHIYKTVLNGVCITEQQLKHFFYYFTALPHAFVRKLIV